MEVKKKVFNYSMAVIFVLFILVSFGMYQIKKDFDSKLVQQEENFQSQIQSLSETVANDMVVIQDLIKNLDAARKQKDDELSSLISSVQQESQAAKTELQKEIATIEVSNTDFSKIAQQSLPAVVSVLTDIGQGSGVFISSDGQIVTNYHVIEDASRISVLTYDKKAYKVSLLGYDDYVDIAVLKINANETFKRLKFGDSGNVKVGESVVALGNPYGLDFTVTQGIISARRKASNNIEYLQMDVAINPGNSGGPIIDALGTIVGIANWRIQGAEGLGFAIPSNTVEDAVDNILE